MWLPWTLSGCAGKAELLVSVSKRSRLGSILGSVKMLVTSVRKLVAFSREASRFSVGKLVAFGQEAHHLGSSDTVHEYSKYMYMHCR